MAKENFDPLVVPKSRDHQNHKDSSCGDHVCTKSHDSYCWDISVWTKLVSHLLVHHFRPKDQHCHPSSHTTLAWSFWFNRWQCWENTEKHRHADEHRGKDSLSSGETWATSEMALIHMTSTLLLSSPQWCHHICFIFTYTHITPDNNALSHMLPCQMPDSGVWYRTWMAWLEQTQIYRYKSTVNLLSLCVRVCAVIDIKPKAAIFSNYILVWMLSYKSHSCGTGTMKKPKQTDKHIWTELIYCNDIQHTKIYVFRITSLAV